MNIQIERFDLWVPSSLLKHMRETGETVSKVDATCGGEHGAVLAFTTKGDCGTGHFTYTMPSVPVAVRAVMGQIQRDPERFPLALAFESNDRAAFRPRT
jgi:hypothetical protein